MADTDQLTLSPASYPSAVVTNSAPNSNIRQHVITELMISVSLMAVVSAVLVLLKIIRVDEQGGDTAMYFQVTKNIAHGGSGNSSIFQSILTYFKSGLLIMPAQNMMHNALAPAGAVEGNLLHWHTYFVLYVAGLLAKFIPVEIVLYSLEALSFTGLLVAAYFLLRRAGVPIVGSALFCFAIMSHPAWSEGILTGQFYPDRLFLLAGFIIILAVAANRFPRWALISVAIVCASIHERAALTAGACIICYEVLYWRVASDRRFKLCVGAALLLYGVVALRFLISNPDYGTFMPTNIAGIAANLHYPLFINNAELFILINGSLLVLACFEWRAALIALIMMLPNLVGNIGGAEKIGWSTHYHSYYFPVLVWAASAGYQVLYRRLTGINISRATPVVCGVALILGLFTSMLGPYSSHPIQFSIANVSNNFVVKFPREVSKFVSPAGFTYYADYARLAQAVPFGSVVSAPEAAMPALYEGRIVNYFPIDVDKANYAVMSFNRNSKGQITFGGVRTYLGADVAAEIDSSLVKRMKRDGYDFNKAKLFDAFDLAVIQRRS